MIPDRAVLLSPLCLCRLGVSLVSFTNHDPDPKVRSAEDRDEALEALRGRAAHEKRALEELVQHAEEELRAMQADPNSDRNLLIY